MLRALPSLSVLLAVLALAGCGGAAVNADSPDGGALAGQPATTPAPTVAKQPSGQLTVGILRNTPLHASPGGRVVAQLVPQTKFHSHTILPVVRVRGPWLGVISPLLPNGKIGWVSSHAHVETYRSAYRIDVSLTHRRVVVHHGKRVLVSFPVAIGAPGTPTPTGRFAVTDKLLTQDPSSPYGCCILALSAQQANTPQGWGGGDRIAIHATSLPQTIGTAASFGCLRAPEAAARRIVQAVPLGTVVTIRA